MDRNNHRGSIEEAGELNVSVPPTLESSEQLVQTRSHTWHLTLERIEARARVFTLKRFRDYLRISGGASISRRYFVLNCFDGAMTMLGILLGSKLGGYTDPKFVIGAGLGASLAMGVSGFSGAYLTERAERLRRLRGLRKAMLHDLGHSIHGKALAFATVWAAVIDGISPALAASVPMVPYVLALFGLFPTSLALPVALMAILALLFSLGAFLGRVSKENVAIAGLRMLAVGAGTALILWVFGGFGI